jgi:hypothetical protein
LQQNIHFVSLAKKNDKNAPPKKSMPEKGTVFSTFVPMKISLE